jgi:hypothetical protein
MISLMADVRAAGAPTADPAMMNLVKRAPKGPSTGRPMMDQKELHSGRVNVSNGVDLIAGIETRFV